MFQTEFKFRILDIVSLFIDLQSNQNDTQNLRTQSKETVYKNTSFKDKTLKLDIYLIQFKRFIRHYMII